MVAPGTSSQRIEHLLDQLFSATDPQNVSGTSVETGVSWREILTTWFGYDPGALEGTTLREFAGWIQETLACIDTLVERQLQEILHAQEMQRIESSWRGLNYLVNQVAPYQQVQVRALDVSWQELAHDTQRTIVFDHTKIFEKIYESEFGSPGGKPLGLLIGDFDITHLPRDSIDTLTLVEHLSGAAAAAFVPLILGGSPQLLGVDQFQDLDRGVDLDRTFAQSEYAHWRSCCSSSDARFLGIAMPRVLIRQPHTPATTRDISFPFSEHTSQHSDYLWCNAAFAFAAVVARSFGETGWFDDFLGPSQGTEPRGTVSNLPTMVQQADPEWPLAPTEWTLLESTTQELADAGFICLQPCKYSSTLMIKSAPNVSRMALPRMHQSGSHENPGTKLNHILAVSRFAHYIKLIGRDLVGSQISSKDVALCLRDWIGNYISLDPAPTPEGRCRYPLRSATVEIAESHSHPGSYQCRLSLTPHGIPRHLTMHFPITPPKETNTLNSA